MASLGLSVLFNSQISQVWQDMVPLHITEAPGCLLELVVLLSSSSQDRGISNFSPVLGRDDPFNCRNVVKKVMLWARTFNGGRGREHWDALELTVLQALTFSGNSSLSKTHPVPVKTVQYTDCV